MESRLNKYSSSDYDDVSSNVPSRSSRNARLYREVYGKYDNLDNLPLQDNTDEIDMNRLQEILQNNDVKQEKREDYHLNVLEQRKRNIDEQRVYDINKILEKAKYENNKLKDTNYSSKIDTSILSTLQSREVSVDEITNSEKHDVENDIEDELSMTRELKFKKLSEETKSSNPLMEHVMPDNDLSLDLFENLKPTENTITTKPIREDMKVQKDTSSNEFKGKIDVHSGDTSDIDIIKIDKNKENENDFFTSSYEFSDKDFFEDEKKGGIFKIILLFLAIIVFSGVIAYFVLTYGIGV